MQIICKHYIILYKGLGHPWISGSMRGPGINERHTLLAPSLETHLYRKFSVKFAPLNSIVKALQMSYTDLHHISETLCTIFMICYRKLSLLPEHFSYLILRVYITSTCECILKVNYHRCFQLPSNSSIYSQGCFSFSNNNLDIFNRLNSFLNRNTRYSSFTCKNISRLQGMSDV